MVFERESQGDSEWPMIWSNTAKIAYSAEAVRKWIRQGECRSQLLGLTTKERELRKELGSEKHDLRQAKEIRRKGVAYFGQGELLDKAPAESVIGLYKTGVIRRWGGDYSKRSSSPLANAFDGTSTTASAGPSDNCPPVGYEKTYFRAQKAQASGSRMNPERFTKALRNCGL